MEGLKGYIYIEAYKQQHVKQAIEDIGNLRLGKWQQQMVPIREMTDVLRVVKDTTGLKRNSWVRIKRGMYKDDVAQVRVSLVSSTRTLMHTPHTHTHTLTGGLCGHISQPGGTEDDPSYRLHQEEGGPP